MSRSATGGNSNPPSGNRFAAETDGSSNLTISQLAPGRVGREFGLSAGKWRTPDQPAAPVNLNGLQIQAPLSSQTYTPASTLTVPANGRIAFVHGDETNSTEKSNVLAALGFSAADLADKLWRYKAIHFTA